MSKHEEDMRVLKTTSCKSVTGKSTLTYQLGATPDDTVHIRITKNTGAGQFSDEWVPFADVLNALKDDDEGAAITSFRLAPLFKGKSVNTPSFLLAALKHLKLVRPMNGKRRHHEALDPQPFLDTVEKLMSSETPVKKAVKKTARKTAGRTVKKKATVKTRTKKKTAPRKKTARTV